MLLLLHGNKLEGGDGMKVLYGLLGFAIITLCLLFGMGGIEDINSWLEDEEELPKCSEMWLDDFDRDGQKDANDYDILLKSGTCEE